MTTITLCRESWKLYDAWQDTLKARPMEYSIIRAARKAYRDHRDNCSTCSPMQDNTRPAPTTPLQGETDTEL